MFRQNFARRLNEVERALVPRRDLRAVLILVGPGSEHFARPTEEEIGENEVMVVQFVAARDGRPA